MSVLTLALLSALMVSSPLPTRADPDPLSAYRWKHRLLVVYVPDTESGRATLRTFRASLDERMQDVLARDLLIVPVGDLPRPGDALRPAVDLGDPARSHVRRRFGLQGREVQFLLIGKDGGMKARQSDTAFDLQRVFELIDSMPMRRADRATVTPGTNPTPNLEPPGRVPGSRNRGNDGHQDDCSLNRHH